MNVDCPGTLPLTEVHGRIVLTMIRVLSRPMQRMITMFLIAGVSVCCCQARVLLGSGNGENCCIEDVVEIELPSCCTEQTDAACEQTGTEQSPVHPGDSCDCCCVKATVSPDGPSIESLGLTVACQSTSHAAIVVDAGTFLPPDMMSERFDWFEPPTLLRLRCALIV